MKYLKLEKINRLNDSNNLIKFDTKIEAEKAIVKEIIETLKQKPKSLIGFSLNAEFKNVYTILIDEATDKIFNKSQVTISTEILEDGNEPNFNNLNQELFLKLGINVKNILTPIRNGKKLLGETKISDFTKKITKKKFHDLILVGFNSKTGAVEGNLPNHDYEGYNQKSSISVLHKRKVATIGLWEIFNARKIIFLINSSLDIKAVEKIFLKFEYDSDFPFSGTLYSSGKVLFFAVKSNIYGNNEVTKNEVESTSNIENKLESNNIILESDLISPETFKNDFAKDTNVILEPTITNENNSIEENPIIEPVVTNCENEIIKDKPIKENIITEPTLINNENKVVKPNIETPPTENLDIKKLDEEYEEFKKQMNKSNQVKNRLEDLRKNTNSSPVTKRISDKLNLKNIDNFDFEEEDENYRFHLINEKAEPIRDIKALKQKIAEISKKAEALQQRRLQDLKEQDSTESTTIRATVQIVDHNGRIKGFEESNFDKKNIPTMEIKMQEWEREKRLIKIAELKKMQSEFKKDESKTRYISGIKKI